MNQQKRNLVLLSMIVLVAIFVWVRGLSAPSGKKQNLGQTAGPVQPGGILMQSQGIGPSRGRARTNFSDWGRNPFVLSEERVEDVRGLTLEGIVWDGTHPLAVINDRVSGVGDTIGKSRITKITQTEVFLKEGESEFTLRLHRGEPD